MNEEAMTPDKEQVVEPLSAEEAIKAELQRERSLPPLMTSSGYQSGLSFALRAIDAARTASVAGLDRERLATLADRIDTFCSACEGDRYLVTADPEDDGQPGDPYQVQCLDSIHACADMVRAAPSIEQEPGETLRAALTTIEAWTRDAKGISRPTLRDLLALIHDTARAALEANPQETLRAAVLYGPDVEFPNLPNGPYLTGPDVLLAVAHYMDRQDDEAERMAAGSGYRANRDVQAHLREWSRRLRAALEADRNPQETER